MLWSSFLRLSRQCQCHRLRYPRLRGFVDGGCRVDMVAIFFAVIVAVIASSCSGTMVRVRFLRGCISVVRGDGLSCPYYTERNYPVQVLSLGR